MKLALVVHDLHEHGGQSIYTRILADELSRRHEVAVFANTCERPADALWTSRHVRAVRGSALACVQSFPLGLRAQESALAEYDVRHMQGFCGGQPNLVTAHICVAAYLDSLRDASMRHRFSLSLMAAAESRFYRRYHGRIIAISHKVADELRKFYDVRGEITIIPHGVDGARFNGENRRRDRVDVRRQMGVEKDDTVALYVGDLTKSHVYLKKLSAACPDIQFAIATYSRAYRWTGKNVQFLKPTSDLHRYYSAADAFVFPTTYDAFGMVVLEAMASGLPVLSSDRAGAAELIENGKDGFVTTLPDWVEATAARLRDRELLASVGLNAEGAARRHDWANVVRQVEKTYFEAVAESGDGSTRPQKLERTASIELGRQLRNGRPTLAVLYGQPERLSTSYQTRQLSRSLETWLDPHHITVKTAEDSKWRRSVSRVSGNYLKPLIRQPDTDYVLYGNDGLANLDHWRAKKVLYWYDAPSDWSKEPPQRRQIAQWLRYKNLLSADHVFAVSHIQVEIARRLRNGREDSVTYLPVGVDCKVFDPATADANRVRQEHKLPAKTIIGYLGYLGIWDGRIAGEPLLEIAPQLLKQHNVHFLIVGFGPALEIFRHRVKQAGLERDFTLTGFVQDESLPHYLAAMDICVDTLEEGFHSLARSETKLKQYMAMARATVATAIGENCVDLDDGKCGVLVEAGSAGLLRGVTTLCEQPELRATLGRAARQRAVEFYDWSVLGERMATALGLLKV